LSTRGRSTELLFYTPEFLIFSLLLVAALLISQHATYRKTVLLLFSYVFYMWWDPAFILLILYSTGLNYLVGLKFGSPTASDATKKTWLIVALVLNLGMLAAFKYFGFFEDNLLYFMKLFGYEPHWTTVNIILPVGISFYTFQAMNYTIDVYRGKIPICRSPLDFALFVSFFPQLIAGPIVRASEFIPQLQKDVRMSVREHDFWLILKGLFKKVIIADNIAVFVDYVFANDQGMPSSIIWLAAIGFTIQIYCDFSGYTDMAIGIGRILGFELPINFRKPFFSGSISEFWRKWHISLSSWINEYVFMPMVLAMRHLANFGIMLAAVLTFCLVGLWHGPAWTFVVFGLLHGLAIAAEVPTKRIRKRIRKKLPEKVHRRIVVTTTLIFILITFIVFRAPDFRTAGSMVKRFVLFDFNFSITGLNLGYAAFFSSLCLMALFTLLHLFSNKKGSIDDWLVAAPKSTKLLFAVGTGVFLTVFWPLSQTPFIYFQF
jgi:alginate O-acetyltransferase complex protein AlgI